MSTKKQGSLLKLKKLDQKLIVLLEELKAYNDITLNRKPAENAWSVLQIMHHLMRAEWYSLLYAQKKLSFGDNIKNAGVLGKVRSVVLKAAINAPFRIKAPETVGENLPDDSTFWEIVKQWKGQREELKDFLESLDDRFFEMELFKHPIAGKMNISGMLDFFSGHFVRHHKQIRKTIEKSLDISKVLMQEEMKGTA